MFSPSKIYGNKKFTAPIKEPGKLPTKSLYAKDVYIYFTNSKDLKTISDDSIFNSPKLPNNQISNNQLRTNIINKAKQKLKSYKTENQYADIQKSFKEFHKKLKKISYYRYIRDKESIEIMPNFKKELSTFKENSYISRNFSKIVAQMVIKIHGVDNIQESLPQLLFLCESLSKETGYYKKEIEYLRNAIDKKKKGNVFNIKKIEEIYTNINSSQSNKGITDYFTMDKKWLLPYFKDKLNAFINKKQRNQDIKDLLSVMNQKYPTIDTAVCLLVYRSKNNGKKSTSYSNFFRKIIKTSTTTNNNSNTTSNIDDIDIDILSNNKQHEYIESMKKIIEYNIINVNKTSNVYYQTGGELALSTLIVISIVVFSTIVAVIRSILNCIVKKSNIENCIPSYFTSTFLFSIFSILIIILFCIVASLSANSGSGLFFLNGYSSSSKGRKENKKITRNSGSSTF